MKREEAEKRKRKTSNRVKMRRDVGRRGNEERKEAKGELKRRAVERKCGKQDRSVSTLIHTHLDEVGTSPVYLF